MTLASAKFEIQASKTLHNDIDSNPSIDIKITTIELIFCPNNLVLSNLGGFKASTQEFQNPSRLLIGAIYTLLNAKCSTECARVTLMHRNSHSNAAFDRNVEAQTL